MLSGCLSIGASGLLLPYLLLLTPFRSVAADSVQAAAAAISYQRTLVADSFAKEKLWYWRNRLNLRDWSVSLAVVRATELRPNTLGNIHSDLESKTAILHVLDPADYSMPFREILDDIEFTVVHELIHLRRDLVLKQRSRSTAGRRKEEKAVNHVTRVLLKLDRGR